MIEDKKIIKMFRELIENNKNYLKKQKGFRPVCFIIEKDYSVKVIMMILSDYNSKQVARNWLQKTVLQEMGIKGYIIAMDTKLSKIHLETKEVQVFDALVHNIFTPKGKIVHTAIYDKDINFIEEFEVLDKGNSIWNVWETEEKDEQMREMEEFYEDYKQDHKDKFKEVLD